jgi:chorismate dehydratase
MKEVDGTRRSTFGTFGRLGRLAVVSYLNARPLIEGLADRFELVEAVPAECWELVRSGQVDLGLIPSIGLGDEPGMAIVPGTAIAAEGPVRSVVLVTRRPIAELRSVAVDQSSRASVALLRILFERRHGIAPRFVGMPPDWRAMLAEHDAALLIGDPALALAENRDFSGRRDLELVDVGAEWTGWTGLPFVFAVWAGRGERVTPEVVAELTAARDRGVARLATIARAAAETPLQEERNLRYLSEAIRYEMGPREIDGLKRYLDLAGELGLLAGGRAAPAELRFTAAVRGDRRPAGIPAAQGMVDGE